MSNFKNFIEVLKSFFGLIIFVIAMVFQAVMFAQSIGVLNASLFGSENNSFLFVTKEMIDYKMFLTIILAYVFISSFREMVKKYEKRLENKNEVSVKD